MSNQLNNLCTNYDNILLLGDFNMTLKDLKLQEFCDTHDSENLIKVPTCSKGIKPTCIGFVLTHHYEV